MTKKELRNVYLEKRISLTSDKYADLNRLISENFFSSIALANVKTLHTFLCIEKNNEPDTWPIIGGIRSQYPQIRICIPRVNETTEILENILFESREQLSKNKWGIPQPHSGSPVPVKEIDLVLIPMIIFDKHGQRVGYGKGYYDKFLSSCRADCQRVGISLFEPVERIDDVDQFDIRMDYCLTPSNLYRF